VSLLEGEDSNTDTSTGSKASGRNGLAGADDIVQFLALLMNKKEISFDQLSQSSGVPSRTIKKWFSGDENVRTMPQLNTVQACFEALGHSIIVGMPSIDVGTEKTTYPIETFRQQLLDEWLEQAAKARDMSVADFIEDLESKHRTAVKSKANSFRRRQF
jgi:transcriptional regulator with XRE-family HTH domain